MTSPSAARRASLRRAAQAALEDGRWAEARAAFETVLAQEPSPDALFGLGNAPWWLGETEASVRHQERAYAGFRRRGDDEHAALTAIYLSLVYNASLGNDAAARGWLARAARVADEAGVGELQGWITLCRASVANDAGDRREAEAQARIAREATVRAGERARRPRDPRAETEEEIGLR